MIKMPGVEKTDKILFLEHFLYFFNSPRPTRTNSFLFELLDNTSSYNNRVIIWDLDKIERNLHKELQNTVILYYLKNELGIVSHMYYNPLGIHLRRDVNGVPLRTILLSNTNRF